MAFLLGSFTSGLFGGAKGVMDIANEYENYRQRKDLRAAADAVVTARNTDPGAQQAAIDAGAATGGVKASGTSTRDAGTGSSFKDSDLAGLPTPKFMEVVKPFGDSPHEGRGFGSGAQPAGPTASTTAPSSSSQSAIDAGGEPSRYTLDVDGARRMKPNEAGYYWSPSTGAGYQEGPNLPGSPSNPATAAIPPKTAPTAPNYLAPGTAGANPPKPQAAIPATPSLASGQAGLGAQILAALNPTAGAKA